MSESFITIADAVKLTGKSRRTIQRLVQTLAKAQPDQVMQEKTSRGYIWRINEQSVEQAYGENLSVTDVASPDSQHPAPAQPVLKRQQENYREVVGQGYAGMMAMHQEVKQVYEDRLQEKEQRIAELSQALAQAQKSIWVRLFGR